MASQSSDRSGQPKAMRSFALLLLTYTPIGMLRSTVVQHPFLSSNANVNPRLEWVSQNMRMQSIDAGTEARPVIDKVVGRTAVITGSSQGSGKATALALARRGWNVVLTAREENRLEAAAKEVEAASAIATKRDGSVLSVRCDIMNSTDVDRLRSSVVSHFRSVDLLVNNAGVCQTASVEHTTECDYERLMQTNFMGAVRVTKAFLPALKASKGTIVNVNSFGGVIPLRGMSAYTSSKFALAGWSEAIRTELQPSGVHVAQVHPGVINSDWLDRAVFEKEGAAARMQETLDSAPFVQTPEEIAEAVLLAEEEQKAEIVVGKVFQAAIAAYRLTGANPFAVQDPNSSG